ncbi:DUF4097 family beta strand repeat-containing protein [Oceanobacillus bengalensis]|nr:DUF4097 family beta strand repeat-containing protein [Oceanobacillus bengalensis]
MKIVTFSNSAKQRLTQKESFQVEAIKKLDITTSHADVEVYIHEESVINILLETYEDGPVLIANIENDHLHITAKNPEKSMRLFSVNLPQCRLQITLPKNHIENWGIKTGSGDVYTQALSAEMVLIRTGSGDVNALGLTVEKANIAASSGDLKIHDLEVNDLEFETSSGNVKLKTVHGKNIKGTAGSGNIVIKNINGERLELDTSSGNIKLENISVDYASFRASSGDIKAEYLKADETIMKTSSGGVKVKNFSGNVKGTSSSGNVKLLCVDDGSFDIKTGSGNITVGYGHEQINTDIEVKTGSGKIKSNLPINTISKAGNKWAGNVGTAENHVHLRTGSGDVKINVMKEEV